MRISKIVINGLFDDRDVTIRLPNSSTLNFVHSKNGSGKTSIFEIIDAAFNLNFERLIAANFDTAEVYFDDNSFIKFGVFSSNQNTPNPVFDESREDPQYHIYEGFTFIFQQDNKEPLPFFMPYGHFAEIRKPSQSDIWVEQAERIGHQSSTSIFLNPIIADIENLTIGYKREEYLAQEKSKYVEHLKMSCPNLFKVKVNLIGASRVEEVRDPTDFDDDFLVPSMRLAEKIGETIEEMANELMIAQQSYFERLVELPLRTNWETIERSLQKLEKLVNELEGGPFEEFCKGINQDSIELVMENRNHWGPANLHIKDWISSLRKCREINARINLFQDLMNQKWAPKSLSCDKKVGFRVTSGARRIQLNDLSLGERSEIGMLYSMIFTESASDYLILVDEPEMGMHVDWKMQFATDLESIAGTNFHTNLKSNFQYVVATHSPTIVDGRIDDLAITEIQYLQ